MRLYGSVARKWVGGFLVSGGDGVWVCNGEVERGIGGEGERGRGG